MSTSTGVSRSTKSSRSKSIDNTKNDRILQISSSTQKKNKVEDHSRIVKSCLNKPNCVVEPSGNANVQHSKLNTNSELMCVKCNSSMFDARHELCFLEFVSDMNASSKSKSVKKAKKKEEWKPTGKVFTKIGYHWRPTGRTFTLDGNACPLTRITATNKVPLREPILLEVVAQESVVTKVVQIVLWYLDSGCSKHMTGDRSQLTNFVHKFLGTVKFGNDQIAKIMGYDDYQIRNITISKVYYVEGLGHNLFYVGQLCDSDLEVAFRKHTCFVRNLEGVDLLSGSRETNLYTLSIGDMMASSPICLLSKASKTKSWLWHQRLSHLNFGVINHLEKNGLVRGLPKLKFEKDICVQHVQWAKARNNHINLNLKTPIRKNYIFYTWIFVKFLASKDEAPDFLIKFLKMIQVRLNATMRNIRTDNETEFVNQTLRDYYEQVDISYETLVEQTPQQNGVVERQNRTLVEAARTMLIYAQAPLFLWAEAVATNLGKFQAKADIGIFIGYAPKKKAYRIYNLHTQKIIETIHVDFDELMAMASEQISSGPGLQFMTPATSSSGLVTHLIPQQLCNPPPRDDWNRLFQPMFDEYFNPLTIAVSPVPDANAPRAVDLANSPVSTSID
ncbi:retrovirus-related pol polyprotein from transposon TNT 1-94 [Tanacetum coccineum]